MHRRSKIAFFAAMLGVILFASGGAFAQRGGGAGGGGGGGGGHPGYNPPKTGSVSGTSKPIKCQAGGAGCMKQK
jgi:hypothetical protein